ncbi:probable receptor-like protein kinase At1g49730 isoform X1 [Dendrobium catenatum]|uniref:probable receptor-like protein kinase At1g49730 isoform X1 n=1 Tax=Dendrobium catenatum TaxID=906689 RepID=UPI0009F2C46F|nr:probable receptor-like protein kinase At1g49730 isoform X1 [Dendrobium catenatum]
MLSLFIVLLFLVVLQEVGGLVAIAGDCPLDFSWANFTLATSACSDPNARGQCCRYINAFVTISIAHYANETGKLGVPSAFSEICLTSVSETFGLHGIPHRATVFCGLGPKIQVSYQCSGRGTVLEMMQSPDFGDVIVNCEMPLTLENNCRRCLNSGILYLHRLLGPDNNVALSMCRDAVFVVLVTQGGRVSAFDMASCFFGLQRLRNLPGLSSQVPRPNSPPSPPSFQSTVQNITNVTDTPLKKHQHSYLLTLIPAVGVVIITIAVLLLLILLILIHKKRRELKCSDDHLEKSRSSSPIPTVHKCQDGPSLMFQRFSYKETMKATDNLSTIIGKGGFGTVYKAQFSDGTIGAVKRMNKISKQGEVEFCREMELLARLHHRHLVALRGFCIDRNERFLVYEYMENGCLKDHLHAPRKASLSWPARLQIAVDVANALEYLHFYCNPPLCHRDIKSSNILLDGNFVAKVADFGLAHASRNGTISFEPVNTDIRGTPGYMDPEYVITQELTEKSDIYSYGVLLLELVTGRRAIQDGKNIIDWSQKFLSSDARLHELVDPAIAIAFDFEQLQVVIEIIQWCTRREGRARPSIKQVLRMLMECLDPVQDGYSGAMEHAGGIERMAGKTRTQRNELIAQSGDARCLMSSSSTSRSYCSRSILLETGLPQSPPNTFFA